VKPLGDKPKITCIVDNVVQSGSRLWGEHGLAFLVEIGDRRVLFDTGQSGAVLLHNLAVLGVDPATTTWYGKGRVGPPTHTGTTRRWSSREPQG